MSARNNFAITGESIVLKPKYPPHLATRKIYNSTYFRDERYRHEIANHYRDFRQRPRIRRHRRRNVLVRYRKPIVAGPISGDPYKYRDELPISVHYFPRFSQVYTPPRGRQCECENRPPDETYNDTVRRIRAATSCAELKSLVQRQNGYTARKESSWRQYNWRRKRLEKYEKPKWIEQDNEHIEWEKFKKNTQQAQQPRQQQLQLHEPQQRRQQKRRRSLGNVEFATKAHRKQITKLTATKTAAAATNNAADSSNGPRERYLQLASEYYERGLLANIKYLESIPERNAIRRARGDNNIRPNNQAKEAATTSIDDTVSLRAAKQTTPISVCENNWNHSRLASAKTNASHSSTNTDETTTPRTSEINERIASILRLIGKQRSFKVSSKEAKLKARPENWAIRVNITPCQEEFEARIQVVRESMHDLNANTGQTTTQHFEANNNNRTASEGVWSPKHLHDLIDNLTHLDLNATSAIEQQGHVPRITLTDYCTISEFAKSDFYAVQQEQQQSAAVFALNNASSAYSSAIVLEPTKFANKTNLVIPSDLNFQDEARPP